MIGLRNHCDACGDLRMSLIKKDTSGGPIRVCSTCLKKGNNKVNKVVDKILGGKR